jgi:hypothetical protein
MEKLGSTGRIFMKFVVWAFFENLSIQVKLKSDKYNVCLPAATYVYLSYLAAFFFEWYIFRAEVVEETKKHISYPNKFLPKTLSFMKPCGKL